MFIYFRELLYASLNTSRHMGILKNKKSELAKGESRKIAHVFALENAKRTTSLSIAVSKKGISEVKAVKIEN